MAANFNVFKTFKKDCVLSKSDISFAKVHWVMYRIRKEPVDTTAARDKLEHTGHAQTQNLKEPGCFFGINGKG